MAKVTHSVLTSDVTTDNINLNSSIDLHTFIWQLSLLALIICYQPAQAESALKPFTLSTPSPITDYSTLSKTHIYHLDQVFNRLGYRLVMIHNSDDGQALESFKNGRYHGAIFIEEPSQLSPDQKIEPALETVQMGFFTSGNQPAPVSWPQGTTVALSENGLKVLSQHLPNIHKNITPVVVNHPVEILRQVQSNHSQYGFTAKALFDGAFTNEHFNEESFTFYASKKAKRSLNLYLHHGLKPLKPKLQQLLTQQYLPKLAEIGNN